MATTPTTIVALLVTRLRYDRQQITLKRSDAGSCVMRLPPESHTAQ